MQQQGYLSPGKSLDAPGYAERKVNVIKKPAKKLFGVLCGFLSRPEKDSLQLDSASFYTIFR